jgi:hypothetical protein
MTGKSKDDLEKAQLKYTMRVRQALRHIWESFEEREEVLRIALEKLHMEKDIVRGLLEGIDWTSEPSKEHAHPGEGARKRASNAPRQLKEDPRPDEGEGRKATTTTRHSHQ